MSSPLVLVVDDEDGVRDLIVDAMSLANIDTVTAKHGLEAITRLRESNVDLVILDINMPTMDGYEVLERMRNGGINTPVIVLTARLDREDTKKAFELGADDFVRKPFGIEELTLRVQAVMRRSHRNENTEVLRCGSVILDIGTHSVTANGMEVELSPTEFRLLQVFLENTKRVMSKDQLLTQVWGLDNFADPNVVETYVSYLRKKFGTTLTIRTVRGVGYQLNEPAGTNS